MSELRNIHGMFGLTYASYLVLPRLMLSSMSEEWQDKFIDMIDEITEKCGHYPESGNYEVRLKDERGRYMKDPLSNYRYGRIPEVKTER